MNHTESANAQFLDLSGNPVQFSFIAMEYYAVILNRTFVIFVTHRMICGAKMIGVVSSPTSGQGVELWRDPRNFIAARTVQKYSGVDPESQQFLSVDAANFQIECANVTRIRFSPRRKFSMGGIAHTGSLYLTTDSGRKRELILLGDQGGEDIQCQLLRLCPRGITDIG